MKVVWLVAGLVAGLAIGTVLPLSAQTPLTEYFYGIRPSHQKLIVCIRATDATIRMGVQMWRSDYGTHGIYLTCPP